MNPRMQNELGDAHTRHRTPDESGISPGLPIPMGAGRLSKAPHDASLKSHRRSSLAAADRQAD